MEAVSVQIGPLVFDHADYDAEGDVLYLHVGEPIEAEGEETPEGHVVRFERGTKRVVGLTVINARSVTLDGDSDVQYRVDRSPFHAERHPCEVVRSLPLRESP